MYIYLAHINFRKKINHFDVYTVPLNSTAKKTEKFIIEARLTINKREDRIDLIRKKNNQAVCLSHV